MSGTNQNPTQPPTRQPPPAAPTGPRTFTADQIRGLYTDTDKLSDVERALRHTAPGQGGGYTMDQLQGLNTKWMTNRSRGDWLSALGGLGSLIPGAANQPSQMQDPSKPNPYDLTMPWARLANDPGFQMMAKNAGYGSTVTPMPGMNPTGWNPSGGGSAPPPSASDFTNGLTPWNAQAMQMWNSGNQVPGMNNGMLQSQMGGGGKR